ncbi:2-amino-4-hydroxy-6-hydroxymethyldihydropteridinediphosphokinase [Aeromonas sp. RU39B]|jgi:2-amino-4-hydroxy-6-hydroxymethyldihydropteridine diphosphokinase|uniref:2-amino-4-hydroxy-6- hydroxymethyldihydropteridine diphosphokinase n=1 Tax=Aeromonas sp. RU39B TaxID=1907416 RepID=UPI000954A252|nr:2-amino-4-hydroxy-6-hydroxymethyldihydropteridine diphosphokinase [Aeromonas sp. RU39B]SIQ49954.1 2-amino-4-hydroxy-6-hydroxymethyldihydropteridinediphosphokinase [Aeromonas sp. RU39B]
MYYLCSIGSNLKPRQHVRQVIGELLQQFGQLSLSSIIRTEPVGMSSHNDFLNCLFVLQSDLDAATLKRHFVELEGAHGRDRSDPQCKVRDRPLDIDILAGRERADFTDVEVDSYLSGLLAELYGTPLPAERKVGLRPLGRVVGRKPCQLSLH